MIDVSSGLDFTAQALRRSIENPAEELNVSFTKAYEPTLRKHHSMMVRPVFSVRREKDRGGGWEGGRVIEEVLMAIM